MPALCLLLDIDKLAQTAPPITGRDGHPINVLGTALLERGYHLRRVNVEQATEGFTKREIRRLMEEGPRGALANAFA